MPAARILLAVCAAAALALVALWAYEQEVKEFYWSLLPSSSGPEQHGASVVRMPPQGTPYDRWIERVRDRVPVFEALVIEDVATVALQPWPQMGEAVRGLYLRFSDYQVTDGRLLELPAGGSTLPQRHLFETAIYFLGGPGHTLVFRDGDEPLRVDWREGSTLAVPMNTRYQHVNDSGAATRLLAVTSFPLVMNAADSERFVFENDFAFTDRFDGAADYFSRSAPSGDKRLAASFVADARTAPLVGNEHRGAGATTMRWDMAGHRMLDLHVTGIPPRSYQKAHRHSSDAFVLMLSGEGYSLIWKGADTANRKRVEWRKGTLFVPPTYWYHQHFNLSDEVSRHLAINTPRFVSHLGLRFADQLEADAPGVEAEWRAELARRAD